jgi:SAM-dependent methyltransferase
VTGLFLTGERTLPGIAHENYWFRRHEAAYSLLSSELAGDRLLEVGVGEGYGADLLAPSFHQTVVLDYDADAIGHVARRYPQLRSCRANLAALPFAAASFDVLVSLQVVEHVWDCHQFLRECRRVLRPGGRLVLSTPNRLTFSPGLGRGEQPANPFHHREFDPAELLELVTGSGFGGARLRALSHGGRLRRLDDRHGGFVAAQLRSAPPAWPRALLADVESVTAADFTVHATAPESGLDLIVVAAAA